jgi:hypothetical protein
MLELVFTVCSIVHGAKCTELPPMQLADYTPMIGCMLASQFEGARYIEQHPNHYIARATCQKAKTFVKV